MTNDERNAQLKELEERFNAMASQSKHACPNCGYCPHCGRGGHYVAPYYPTYPQPSYPWERPWITWTTVS